jgi:hypothetical protein
VAPGFSAVQALVATDGQGTPERGHHPSPLVRVDARGVMPRLGVAWRGAWSSLVIRGGYGLYRNTNVYQSLALLRSTAAVSTTASVASTRWRLTLANGFARAGSAAYACPASIRFPRRLRQNWQVSAQRDLPASLTIIATYLGSRGQPDAAVPANTYPGRGREPMSTCPTGFAHFTSTGQSLRNAGRCRCGAVFGTASPRPCITLARPPTTRRHLRARRWPVQHRAELAGPGCGTAGPASTSATR